MRVKSAFAGVGVYVVDPFAAERFTDLVEWVAVLARTTTTVDVDRIRNHVAPLVHAWEDQPREGPALRRRLGVYGVIEQAETPDAYAAARRLLLGRPRAFVGLEMSLPLDQRCPYGWGWHGEAYEGPNPNATPERLAFRALAQGGARVFVPVVGVGSWKEGTNPPLETSLAKVDALMASDPRVPGWAIYNGDECPQSDIQTMIVRRKVRADG